MKRKIVLSILASLMLICLAFCFIGCDDHQHKYDEQITQPTCMEKGFTTFTCECGDTYISNYVDKTAHTEQWVTDIEATCVAQGSKHKQCSTCKEILAVESIAAKGHTEVVDKEVKPTCTTEGLAEGKHCSVCNAVITAQKPVEKLAHTESDWIVDVEATCMAQGIKHKECSTCKEVLAMEGISAKAHTVVVDKEVKPTCAMEGLSEGKHCATCNVVIVPQEKIEKLNHTPTDWIVDTEATCTVAGSKHKECSVCKEVLETEETPAKGHTEVTDAAVAATCAAEGLTEGKHCSVCNAVIVAQTPVEKLPHTPTDWMVDTQATCTSAGIIHKECSTCKEVLETEEIAKLAHTEEWVIDIDATCTEVGIRHKECSACKTLLAMEAIPAKGHTEAVNEAVAPTCMATGLTEGKYCSVCNVVLAEQKVVEKLDHTPSEWVVDVEATCKEVGSQHKECTVCKEVLETEELAMLQHSEEWIVDKEATCTEVGSKHAICSLCKTVLVEQETIEKLPHTPSDWKVDKEATCTEVGSQHKECSVCNEVLETEELAMVAHTEEWVTTEATCTEDGTKNRQCSVCNEVFESVTIPASGHTEVTDKEVTPTCATTGLTEGKHCSVCNAILLAQETIEKLPHTPSEWIVDAEATCAAVGNKHIECTVCKEVLETQENEKLPHTPSEWIVDAEATCAVAGSKHIECTVCKEALEKEELTKLPHTPSDWKVDKEATCKEVGSQHKECTVCQEVLETEEIAILPHTCEWIVEIEATCDVPGIKRKECTVCGKILTREIIPASHKLTHVEKVEPTETEAGVVEHWHCSACNKNFSDENCTQEIEDTTIPMLPEVVVPAENANPVNKEEETPVE